MIFSRRAFARGAFVKAPLDPENYMHKPQILAVYVMLRELPISRAGGRRVGLVLNLRFYIRYLARWNFRKRAI